jgi:5-oxoprolinase (ATP-hydrolysing) subunit A
VTISQIDLNADVGESYGHWSVGDDTALMDAISSANIACGHHAGDPTTLRSATNLAAKRSVTIGAHVAYPDLIGFGRRFLDIAPHDLRDSIVYQIGALQAFARIADQAVRYVKPHGALYNTVLHHDKQAQAVVEAIVEYDPALAVVGVHGSVLQRATDAAGIRFVHEFFADRSYLPDGTLVPRDRADAVIDDPEQVADRVSRLIETGEIIAADASVLRQAVMPETICVHGDTNHASAIAHAVRARVADMNTELRPFAS